MVSVVSLLSVLLSVGCGGSSEGEGEGGRGREEGGGEGRSAPKMHGPCGLTLTKQDEIVTRTSNQVSCELRVASWSC